MGIVQSYDHDEERKIARQAYDDGIPSEFMGLYDLSHLFPKIQRSNGNPKRGVKKRKLSANLSVTADNEEAQATEAAIKQYLFALHELTLASEQLDHFYFNPKVSTHSQSFF